MKNRSGKETTIRMLALSKFVGLNPRLFESLLFHFETLERIMRADSGKLMAIDGLSTENANNISQLSHYYDQAELYLEELNKKNIKVCNRFDPEFPQGLHELNDPPLVLYYQGKLPDNKKKKIAITGSEDATPEGIALTVNLAKIFAKNGVQLISSLSGGIDSSVHISSRTYGGESFAVLESGFDKIRQKESEILAKDIVLGGGIISEYPPEEKGLPSNYAYSNRIISAMAQAVVVTEVYNNSKRSLDLIKCCNQIGKLSFLQVDPQNGALVEEKSMEETVRQGAIPMVGLDKVDDIIKSLV